MKSELKFQKKTPDDKPIEYRVVNEKNEHVVFNVIRDANTPDELGVCSVTVKEKPKTEGDKPMKVKVQIINPGPEMKPEDVEQTTTAAEIASVLGDASNKSNFVIHRTLDDVIPGVDTWRAKFGLTLS